MSTSVVRSHYFTTTMVVSTVALYFVESFSMSEMEVTSLSMNLRADKLYSRLSTLDPSESNIADNIDIFSYVEVILRSLGPIMFILLQISALITSLTIIRSRTTSSLSPVPFHSLIVNCIVWSLYGISKGDKTIYIPNCSGVFVGFICTIIFHIFAKEKPLKNYIIMSSIIILTTIIASFEQTMILGFLGCILSVLLTASPLAVIRTVIEEKSTKSLPFGTSLILFINAFSWMTYGTIIAADPMIYGPNIFNLMLATLQLLLFIIFGFHEKDKV